MLVRLAYPSSINLKLPTMAPMLALPRLQNPVGTHSLPLRDAMLFGKPLPALHMPKDSSIKKILLYQLRSHRNL